MALLKILRDDNDYLSKRVWEALGKIGIPAKEVLTTPSADELALEFEAHSLMPQLKIFYLVYRVFMEGKESLRAASDALIKYRLDDFGRDDLAINNVSFSEHVRGLESFFKKVLNKASVSMLFIRRRGLAYQFTDDAKQAWNWTDAFLRKYLDAGWFGFSRLTPENES